jgi:uncharacterized protein (TIGR03435 family)
MIRILAGLVFITILNTPYSHAQSQTEPKPSFEVASIKPIDSCLQRMPGGVMFTPPSFEGGRYKGCNTLKRFMEEAYQTEVRMIEGGPEWAGGDFMSGASYQIEAKTDPSTDKKQMRLMLQSLLEERFKMKIHREPREMQIYSLVVAKDGPKLLPAKLDENGKPVAAVSPPDKDQPAMRGGARDWRLLPQLFGYGDTSDGGMEFFATAISLTRFAEWLSNPDVVKRKVVDKTGIAGLYDFRFKYAADRPMNQTKKNEDSGKALPDPSGPSIFKAVQEQFGLKLELEKTKFEFIVIDSAEKPSEN